MLKTVTPGEALSILYSAFGARRTEAEACPLALARGRVLAEDVEESRQDFVRLWQAPAEPRRRPFWNRYLPIHQTWSLQT